MGYEVVQSNKHKIEIQADKLEEIAAYCLEQFPDVNCFVEDAGIFVEGLNGFPGPYSAYVFRTLGTDGLLWLMRNKTSRRARFVSIIAFRDAEEEKKLFFGETIGVISTEERGKGGFGFDPVFIPEGAIKTYAEMSPSEKDAVSHRGKATRALGAYLNTQEIAL